MEAHYSTLSEEMDAYEEEDIQKIKAYSRSSLPEVRDSLRQIETVKRGIHMANVSRNEDSLRTQGEKARIHGVDEEKMQKSTSRVERLAAKKYNTEYKLGTEATYDEQGNIVEKDFIPAYVNYSKEMKYLHELLNTGKIVETDYVKKIIEEAMPSLTKRPPTIVYLHGDFGTGKTALAVHLSRTRFKNEPIIVSGSKFLDPDRFTEEFKIQKLSLSEVLNILNKDSGTGEIFDDSVPDDVLMAELAKRKGDFRDTIVLNRLKEDFDHANPGEDFDKEKFDQYVEDNKEKLPEEFSADIEQQLEGLFGNQVQGRYVLGAMYKAMTEGKPLIIDEANAITPEVLIAFNDLLTKKPGDIIQTRTDSGDIQVKDGYCVIWTGNTGERYKQARYNDMDPASYSRIHPIKMGYLPQSREVSNIDELLGRLDLEKLADTAFADFPEAMEVVKKSKERAKHDQIFQVLLVKLLNDRMGAELLVKQEDRFSVFKDIYRLSMGARIIMDMFEGSAENLPEFRNLDQLIGAGTTTNYSDKLKKSNLTMRELIDNVIGGYMDEGTNMDIEYYLYKYIRKYDQFPEEQVIIYSILEKAGFFQSSEKWPDYTTTTGGDQEENLKNWQKTLTSFNPHKSIDKYKSINQNGDAAGLLNTDGKYNIQYFSSLETLQLLFGYLPPRKKAEYEKMQGVYKEMAGIDEMAEKVQRLITDVREIKVAVLQADLFDNASEIREYREHIEKTKLVERKDGEIVVNEDFRDNTSDEEFVQESSDFYDMLLDLLQKKGIINEETRSAADGMDLDAKGELIKSALKGKT
jgi:MoxR-like ATPase